MEKNIRSRQDLAIWAVRFGQPLLDKDGIWNGITRRWRNRLPLPDPAVALDRAAAARIRMEKMCAVGDEEACAELEISYRTHLARASLATAGVQPASRPELPSQLRELGETALAVDLERTLSNRADRPIGQGPVGIREITQQDGSPGSGSLAPGASLSARRTPRQSTAGVDVARTVRPRP